jgi:Beta-lactamase enzyme family
MARSSAYLQGVRKTSWQKSLSSALVVALLLLLGGAVGVSPASAATPDPVAVSGCGPSPLAPSFLTPWTARAGGIDVGISVVDVDSGCSFGSLTNEPFLTASVVKLQIMAGVLLTLQDADQPVSYYLDGLLHNMIGASDNSAADDLTHWLGGLGQLQVIGERFGLVDTDNLWAGDWGSTLTTATDQTKLMTELLERGGPLSSASRAIARSYLNGVQADQRWGVGSVSGDGVTALVKNGWWYNAPGDNGVAYAWRLNSVGLIESADGRAWSVAILGNEWSTESDTRLIDELAQHIANFVLPYRAVSTVSVPTPTDMRAALEGMKPVRLIDTRDRPVHGVASGSVVVLDVARGGEVPAAVALNVTAVDPVDAGFLTVYPTGVSRPQTSNLNVSPKRTVANFAVTPVSADGKVSVYTFGRTDIIVDLVGRWMPTDGQPVAAGRFRPVTPARVFDTRSTASPMLAGSSRPVKVVGVGGIPLGATGVAVSVTVTEATADGFWTVWGSDSSKPQTSNVNVRRNDTIANTSIVTPGADGNIEIYSQAGGHVIVDVVGWYTGESDVAGTDGLLAPLAAPVRIVDSRSSVGANRLSSGRTAVTIGEGSGFVGNLTWLFAQDIGFITVWPTGAAAPNTSVANPDPNLGEAFANALLMGNGSDGEINVTSSKPVDLLIDVSAIFT